MFAWRMSSHIIVPTHEKEGRGEAQCSCPYLSEAEKEANTSQDPQCLRSMLEHLETTRLTYLMKVFTRLHRRDLYYRV